MTRGFWRNGMKIGMPRMVGGYATMQCSWLMFLHRDTDRNWVTASVPFE